MAAAGCCWTQGLLGGPCGGFGGFKGFKAGQTAALKGFKAGLKRQPWTGSCGWDACPGCGWDGVEGLENLRAGKR